MAKSSKARKNDGKALFQARLDQDVYDGLKKSADKTGVSMNQMLQGIIRAAIRYAHEGQEIENDQDTGFKRVVDQEGAVWFGRGGYEKPKPGIDPEDVSGPEDLEWVPIDLFYQFDFTERRVVRDDSGPVE